MADFRHETERLVLRDWRDEDWAPFWKHTNTPAVMQWLGGVLSEEKRQYMRDRWLGFDRDYGFTFWIVERKDDGGHLSGEILGFCGLKRVDEEGGPSGEHEVGWRLREDAWGHGYAKEAALASLEIGFITHNAPQILALTVHENTPSWGLMKRLGMERRADLDFESTLFGSESIITYGITREQWDKQQ